MKNKGEKTMKVLRKERCFSDVEGFNSSEVYRVNSVAS